MEKEAGEVLKKAMSSLDDSYASLVGHLSDETPWGKIWVREGKKSDGNWVLVSDYDAWTEVGGNW